MSTILVDIIAGARPNFMKIAPIIRAIQAREAQGGPLRYRLVHTGQHYDEKMSGDFFRQLGIPAPDVNLEVGSGTQSEQTGTIMTRYEKLLLEKKPALCLVVGDVTSTMACSIAAQKLCVKVAHVEAGIRSGDWTMPALTISWGDILARSLPSKTIEPALGRKRPEMVRSVVVLPAPLEPMSATSPPAPP